MRPKAGYKKGYLSLLDLTEIALVLYPKSNIWIQNRFISQFTEKQ
jgi:hypothetical protein